MLAPEDLKWEDCSAALPPGAKCAVLEGDLKAANVLFGYRVEVPDGYRIAPHFHPADEHLLVVRVRSTWAWVTGSTPRRPGR